MIKKYALLASFVFGMGVLFVQACEAKKFYCCFRGGNKPCSYYSSKGSCQGAGGY